MLGFVRLQTLWQRREMFSALIQQYAQAEFDADDDQGVVDALNAHSIDIVDEALYTWAGVALYAGPEAAEGFRIALDSNGMGWAIHQLGGSGLQISNPMVKGVVEQFIAGGLPLQPLLDQVFQTTSPAEQGLGRAVTLEEITEWRASQAFQSQLTNAIALFKERMQAGSDPGAVMSQAWSEAV